MSNNIYIFELDGKKKAVNVNNICSVDIQDNIVIVTSIGSSFEFTGLDNKEADNFFNEIVSAMQNKEEVINVDNEIEDLYSNRIYL